VALPPKIKMYQLHFNTTFVGFCYETESKNELIDELSHAYDIFQLVEKKKFFPRKFFIKKILKKKEYNTERTEIKLVES
jgi:hypothetical protein